MRVFLFISTVVNWEESDQVLQDLVFFLLLSSKFKELAQVWQEFFIFVHSEVVYGRHRIKCWSGGDFRSIMGMVVSQTLNHFVTPSPQVVN